MIENKQLTPEQILGAIALQQHLMQEPLHLDIVIKMEKFMEEQTKVYKEVKRPSKSSR